MSEKSYRLNKVAAELNKSFGALAEHLTKKGFQVEAKPTTKITEEMYQVLLKDFSSSKAAKEESKAQEKIIKQQKTEEKTAAPTLNERFGKPTVQKREEDPSLLVKNAGIAQAPKTEKQPEPPVETEPAAELVERVKPELAGPKVLGKVDLKTPAEKSKKAKSSKTETPETEAPVAEVPKEEKTPKTEKKKEEKTEKPAPEVEKTETKVETPVAEEVPAVTETVAPAAEEGPEKHETVAPKLRGLKILDKIQVVQAPTGFRKDAPALAREEEKKKRKRKKIQAEKVQIQDKIREQERQNRKPNGEKTEVSQKEVQDKIKTTLAKLQGAGTTRGLKQKIKQKKREDYHQANLVERERLEKESKVLKVTEFVSANELASLMNVNVTQIIMACMNLGLMVSINQRLDAETLTLVADEFGYSVEFVDAEAQLEPEEPEDDETNLVERPPVVTIMGHVDHGKTSLLDYIREANIVAGEAGGITQHIGAYEVTLPNNKKITFLDTPGHEAFTAMRARGAKVTDIAIIVIAADDSVMPQTREAISHAQAAGVPMIFAINKVDKESAKPDKIREELSGMNILVEEWGGKFQCQEISAKKGLNIDKLLEKVLLEAEMLQLKANPNRLSKGTVIEAQLDKGRGIVTNLLVQTGTLRVGDHLVAGPYYGKVKALFNERGAKIDEAPPSTPVKMLGFSESPSAGDTFVAFSEEEQAKDLANKRFQLVREQGLRAKKHITLDEIGRRLAVGNFKELNLIVKGDVDGSVEALSDSFLKLSTGEIQVNVIHKGVGPITESDVLLASASDAIIIGFQVRPVPSARKLAEAEEIDIRTYSIIYQAIEEVKKAMEGMLSPEVVEKVIGQVEIRQVFKISKVGTVAGCYVTEGKIERSAKVRVVRDGVVMYTGDLESLKRFKDDVKEVARGYECGLQVKNYNDIREGDYLEVFKEEKVQRKLD